MLQHAQAVFHLILSPMTMKAVRSDAYNYIGSTELQSVSTQTIIISYKFLTKLMICNARHNLL